MILQNHKIYRTITEKNKRNNSFPLKGLSAIIGKVQHEFESISFSDPYHLYLKRAGQDLIREENK
jgi:hypothetical protein